MRDDLARSIPVPTTGVQKRALVLAAGADDTRAAVGSRSRLVAHGKYFCDAGGPRRLHGVTYGPFRNGSHGAPFPEEPRVAADLHQMREAGIDCLRTFTVPPAWLLDRAADAGLGVLPTIPWAQHLLFLDDRRTVQEVRSAVRSAADRCGNHPALVGLLIGNEIPSDIVRWYGPRQVSDFLRRLCGEVKDRAPDALVSYASFPSTEYLDTTEFVDFVSFNVYLHHEHDLRRYLSRLQNLAGDKPLVLTELGVDAVREGREAQAQMLSWMLATSLQTGAAGTFVFSWTDDWFVQSGGGWQMDSWAFGLVDRERRPKPVLEPVGRIYRSAAVPLPRTPRVSVVVCAYDAESTLDSCLASLRTLRYPDYEVIVVDDGSRDATAGIAAHHQAAYQAHPGAPRFRLLRQRNEGLSAARNAGLAAATGEIVAYTDSDCVADPDWLAQLVASFERGGYAAVGGPNLPPPEERLVPAAVAVAPGGPNHVLIDDQVAEHVPGCNMAFRRDRLQEIGGFDPVYRAAGDDVDVCWRLQERGAVIGFSPGAVVWHFRRNTVRAYLKQQEGYGHAEALLFFKHPERFNAFGQLRWAGRIYGRIRAGALLGRPAIYFGRFGTGPFQLLYAPPASLLDHLPFTLEWNSAALVLPVVAAGLAPRWTAVALLPLLVTAVLALRHGAMARIEPRFAGLRAALLVGLLTWLGPLARGRARTRTRLRRGLEVEPDPARRRRARVDLLRRAFTLRYWSERGHGKEAMLGSMLENLRARGVPTTVDSGWARRDAEVHANAWVNSSVRVAVEDHGGEKRLFNVWCEVRLKRPARIALLCCAALGLAGVAAGKPFVAGAALVAVLGMVLATARTAVQLGQVMVGAIDDAARRLAATAVRAGAS